jgi:hypothetical protein
MIVGIGVDIADISPAALARRMAPAARARQLAPVARTRRMAQPWADLLFAQREQKRSARSLA